MVYLKFFMHQPLLASVESLLLEATVGMVRCRLTGLTPIWGGVSAVVRRGIGPALPSLLRTWGFQWPRRQGAITCNAVRCI